MNRHNNFDLLRLLAALGVMALHVVHLTGEPQLAILARVDNKMALSTFFVISGYLVYMSCATTPSLTQYMRKRWRRIAPAYMAVVVLCSLLGVFISTLPASAYFGADWLRYMLANLSFLNFAHPSLPGVFTDNPFPGAPVNGALWTIKVELMFYATLPIILWLVRRHGHHRVLGLGYVFSCLWWGGFMHLAGTTGKAGFVELAKQMPGQLMYFLPGAWAYCERARLARMGHSLGLMGALAIALTYLWDGGTPTPGVFLYPLALTALVFWAANTLRPQVNASRYGDLSYGIYLTHFPVIQTLVHFGVFKASPWGGVGLALALVVTLALASWHLVERPMMGKHT